MAISASLVTVPDAYPLPNMQDFSVKESGCTIFSKIDLHKGYCQLVVNPEDVPKTAISMPFGSFKYLRMPFGLRNSQTKISTPFGLFKYPRMPFGLRNSGNTFQRHMDRVLAGLNGVFAFQDDVLVSSADETQHAPDLQKLFCCLREHGLVISTEKCLCGVRELYFLGHRVSATGVSPLPEYVEAVEDFPPPTTVKEMQQFLGLVNFYRRSLPGLGATLKPLTVALQGAKKGADMVPWSSEKEVAFTAAKSALAAASRWPTPIRLQF